jgi:hypothetical protein
MADDYAGITALLNELRRKAAATQKFYLGIDRDTFNTKDWPRNAEIELIENLLAQKALRVTGLPEIPESLWRRCMPFAKQVSSPWREKEKQQDGTWSDPQQRYEFGESKVFEAIVLWVDHTLDFLTYLRSSATDTPAENQEAILFLAANTNDDTRLRLDEELRGIRDELERAKLRDRLVLHPRGAVRPKDFVRAMLDLKPAYVHFSGHGRKNGAIRMENENGGESEVLPEAIAELFHVCGGRHVKCVLLNACFSHIQANAIAKHVPYVIGMLDEIGDGAAIAFAAGFYRAIGADQRVPKAFDCGLLELKLYSIPEESIPVLVPGVSQSSAD